MPYIEYENGHISRWDDTISVGQLIKTYYSGFFILERIEYTDAVSQVKIVSSDTTDQVAPIFHFTKVLNEDGTKSKLIRKSCSAIYCTRITRTAADFIYGMETQAAVAKHDAIHKFLGTGVSCDKIETQSNEE